MPDDPKQPIAPEVSATACEALTALCVSKVRARAPVHGCFSSPSVPLPPLFVISHNSDLHSSCPHCPHCLQNATNRPSATPRSLSLALSLSLSTSLSLDLFLLFFLSRGIRVCSRVLWRLRAAGICQSSYASCHATATSACRLLLRPYPCSSQSRRKSERYAARVAVLCKTEKKKKTTAVGGNLSWEGADSARAYVCVCFVLFRKREADSVCVCFVCLFCLACDV